MSEGQVIIAIDAMGGENSPYKVLKGAEIFLEKEKNTKIIFFGNENQIYEYLKERYGEWILFDPEFNKNTYFLWLMPILFFVIGGLVIFKLFIIRKN